ncbi:MAG: RNA polymerase sigma factor FliA [Myxococcales bacterium]|nr:RNA polymerase sigma factor FliA [Myxococcales bacterium]
MSHSSLDMNRAEARAKRTLSVAEYEKFLPLVRRTAMRLARKVPAHITVADLVSYGWLGLVEAFQRADGNMSEEEFEAYASYRVRGAMLDFLRSLDPTTRSVRAISRNVTKSIATLSQKLGRAPEEHEIAEAMGVTVDAYRQLLSRVGEHGMARLEVLDVDQMEVADAQEGADDLVVRKNLLDAVTGAIETLPPRLQQILALYYQEECTMREIGAVLGVSEARVCQLHAEAIHRLRASVGGE